MRTSLTEIRDIEKYLLDELPAGESLVFAARMITDAGLRSRAGLQRKLYELLVIYQRKKTKEEIQVIHDKLFSSSHKGSFRHKIELIFNQ